MSGKTRNSQTAESAVTPAGRRPSARDFKDIPPSAEVSPATVIQRAKHQLASRVNANGVLMLQRTIGNQATLQLLRAQVPSQASIVQRMDTAPGVSVDEIREAAAEGVHTPAGALPHSETLQKAFGAHDISQIQAHIGPQATASAEAMNAKAYATGDHVVFAGTPDLRTTAHETAHVVQQRAGVQIANGIGQAGDAYERHADAVAEGVVSGRSVETLLDSATGIHVPRHRATTSLVQHSPPVQLGRGKPKKGKGKKKSAASTRYVSLQYAGSPPVVSKVFLGSRPPSNSRSGQGDHIVAYALIQQAILRAVKDKQVDKAGEDLAELVEHAKTYVKTGAINNAWHANADNLITSLNGIDVTDEDGAKAILSSAANNVAILLNIMPGATKKNKKSTGGHAEAQAIGGLATAEKKAAAGAPLGGNPWVNILGLIDLDASPEILSEPTKLEQKIKWLMTLVSHAAPTLYSDLETAFKGTGNDAQLNAATLAAYDPLVAVDIEGYIEAFMNS